MPKFKNLRKAWKGKVVFPKVAFAAIQMGSPKHQSRNDRKTTTTVELGNVTLKRNRGNREASLIGKGGHLDC
jgi:hypothetical protein